MIRPELADTLQAIAESVLPQEGVPLIVSDAIVDLPLEISSVTEEGQLVFFARPPHTRWKAGFLPRTHLSRLHVGLMED
jgi:hypothetical protein